MRSFLCTFCRVLSVFGPFFCECVNPWSLLVLIFALDTVPFLEHRCTLREVKVLSNYGISRSAMVFSYSVSFLLLRKIGTTLCRIYQSFFLVGVIKYRDYAFLRFWDKAVGLFLIVYVGSCIKGIWAKF